MTALVIGSSATTPSAKAFFCFRHMQQLRTSDSRKIWQLLGECRELGDDALYWMSHLARGLVRLVNAGPVMAGELVHDRNGVSANLGVIDVGFECGFERQGWINSLKLFAIDPYYHPVLAHSLRGSLSKDIAVSNRPMVIGNKAWERCDAKQMSARVMGTDDTIVSAARLSTGPNDIQLFVINRAENESNFSTYELELVRQLTADVTPLIGRSLAGLREPSPSQLSPRCRETLACILEGDSDRQIAMRLSLSSYTVNQYVKAIFRHFQVTSRGELMSRWIRRGCGAKFAWRNGPVPVVETVPK